MPLQIVELCLFCFLLGIGATNSWHSFRKRDKFKKEKCHKGGVHEWRLTQVFTKNGVEVKDETLMLRCSKCGKEVEYKND